MKRTTFDLLLPIARGRGEPLRLQVIRELRAAVQAGRLAPGSPLPSTRALAADLGLSRGLVVEAYEQLVAEGYLSAQRGSATRVASSRPVPAPRRELAGRRPSTTRPRTPAPNELPAPRIDFRPGVPDVSLFPARAWARALRRAFGAGAPSALDYPDPAGVAPARHALAAYLDRSRATVADPEHVVLCTGFAQAARIVCEVLRARGVRRIAVEDPGHADQCADLRAAGLQLVPVPVDDRGIVVERLQRLDVGAVLVTPAHQYPTGALLEPARRAALLEWAARRRAIILEDDYDAEYRYDREPVGALQGLAPDRVVYIGSASKMLAPALRQGWLVVPADLVDDVRQAKHSADRGSPALEQLAFAAFLEAGELDRHLRRTRVIYRRRRDALTAALAKYLPGCAIHGVAAGLHLLVDLPRRCNEARVVALAAERDMRVYGAAAYFARPDAAPPALLLGYGGLRDGETDGIDRAVAELARIVRDVGAPRRSPAHPSRTPLASGRR
jgi:GntR family transcriptional regulator / MocR family aminotransferase